MSTTETVQSAGPVGAAVGGLRVADLGDGRRRVVDVREVRDAGAAVVGAQRHRRVHADRVRRRPGVADAVRELDVGLGPRAAGVAHRELERAAIDDRSRRHVRPCRPRSTAMLVYMPTFGPSSSMPPRTFESGTVTGPSGTPSTHSHASSGMRPPVRLRDDEVAVRLRVRRHPGLSRPRRPRRREYGPTRPSGMSSEHTHVLSMQNGSSPCAAAGSQSSAVSQAWRLVVAIAAGLRATRRPKRRPTDPRS